MYIHMRCSRNNWKVVILKTIDFICVLSPHTLQVMHKPWIRTIHGLPGANRGSMLCSTIHRLQAQSVDPRFAQHSQASQTKGKGRNCREGLRSAVQGDVKDSYLGLGILHCSFGGLG